MIDTTSYDIVKTAFSIAAVILGAGMLIKSEKFLKKGSGGSEAEINKIKTAGKVVVVLGTLVTILNIVLALKY